MIKDQFSITDGLFIHGILMVICDHLFNLGAGTHDHAAGTQKRKTRCLLRRGIATPEEVPRNFASILSWGLHVNNCWQAFSATAAAAAVAAAAAAAAAELSTR